MTILDQNYRSTGNILEGANGVIKNNDDRHPKDLWTAAERGRLINVRRSFKDSERRNGSRKRSNRFMTTATPTVKWRSSTE